MTSSAGSRGRRRRIVFASIAAGGSHMSTAAAMKEAIEREFPGKYEIDVFDIMREFGFTDSDRRHKAVWKAALANPWSIVLVQHLIDASPRITNRILRISLRDFAAAAARRFRESDPALIVANHGWMVVAMTTAQRRYGLDVPVVSFETSTLNANALWAEQDAERFIVASPVSARRLARLGVPTERIDVVGYPVRASFLDAPSKSAARKRLGLGERFTVLVSLGGEGVGVSVEAVLEAAEPFGNEIGVVLIAGRNRELYRSATEASRRIGGLTVRGFVDNMADYVAACDVVVGKTGPAAVYEILSVGRPIIAPRKSGLVENKLLSVLERNRIGCYAPTAEEIGRRLRRYLEHPRSLEQVSATCRDLDFPGMAKRIARYLDGYASNRLVPEGTTGRGLTFRFGKEQPS
jgi:1,2-diacylglycerol 3-beta-galactosyltransferase